MAIECERKFLVCSDGWKHTSSPGVHFRQGYICSDPARTVRIRIIGDRAELTLKGETRGFSRQEFEYPVPVSDAEKIFAHMVDGPVIEKIRFECLEQDALFVVDEFLGQNSGLVVAEIELQHPDQWFPRPDWLGSEVTGDPRYYNSALARMPFMKWK